jgi:hypothetical protein
VASIHVGPDDKQIVMRGSETILAASLRKGIPQPGRRDQTLADFLSEADIQIHGIKLNSRIGVTTPTVSR